MGYHDVCLLRFVFKLDRLPTLSFSALVGIFVGPLRGILIGVFLLYLTLLGGVSGPCAKHVLSPVV